MVPLTAAAAVTASAKLAGHSAPHGSAGPGRCSARPPGDPPVHYLPRLASGFLSFAGFEAAATLGEETKQPRRDIPRAMCLC